VETTEIGQFFKVTQALLIFDANNKCFELNKGQTIEILQLADDKAMKKAFFRDDPQTPYWINPDDFSKSCKKLTM